MYGNPAYTQYFGAPFVPGKLVKMMYFGSHHVTALTSDGELWGWGMDPLALGGIRSFVPVPVYNASTSSSPVVSAAVTANGTVIVNAAGEVWYLGQIAGVDLATITWERIMAVSAGQPFLVSVKCGYAHCVAQALNGKLYGFGLNDLSQVNFQPSGVLTSLIEIPGTDTITNLASVQYCTGAKHTSILINRSLWMLGSCAAIDGACFIPSRLPRFLNLTFSDTVLQVECGAWHTVVKTAERVYATGANDVGQVSPASPSPIVPTLVEVPQMHYGPNKIIVVGNTTIGRNEMGFLTGFGLNQTTANSIGGGSLGNSTYDRPPWLRMLSVDEGAGTPLRYTFGVRFREADTCIDPRPIGGAVCLPTSQPGVGRWSMQRPLQMAANRSYAAMVLNKLMAIYGDFILESDASLAFEWPEDPDTASLQVDGCAQIDGALSLSITSDVIQDIRKNHKGKREVKLISSNCPFFGSAGNSRRTINIILENEEEMAPEDVSTPSNSTTPDISVEPTDSAKSGSSSTNAVLLEPSSTPTASSSSSCSKTTVSTEEQTSNGITTLVAVVKVNSSACNTWWIITASVVGGIVLIVGVALLVVFTNPTLKAKILPYLGSKT
jgi:hypothetical protein